MSPKLMTFRERRQEEARAVNNKAIAIIISALIIIGLSVWTACVI